MALAIVRRSQVSYVCLERNWVEGMLISLCLYSNLISIKALQSVDLKYTVSFCLKVFVPLAVMLS